MWNLISLLLSGSAHNKNAQSQQQGPSNRHLVSLLLAGSARNKGTGDNNAQSQQQGPSNNLMVDIEKENRDKENGANDGNDANRQKRKHILKRKQNERHENTLGCMEDAFGSLTKKRKIAKKKQAPPKKTTQQTSPQKNQKTSSKEKPKDPPDTTNKITSSPKENTLFETMVGSNFIKDLLPLLNKLGIVFHGNSKGFSYGESFNVNSEEALRRHLCRNGIPKVHILSQEEREFVELWARYAHVPESHLTHDYPQFSNETEIKEALVEELKLENLAGRFFKSNGEEIGTLQEVRVLLRSTGTSELGSICDLHINSRANLLIWAARCTDPLPEFGRFTEKVSTEVWPILERTKVWTYRPGRYLLEYDGDVIETLLATFPDIVLQYCVRKGIPVFDALSETDKVELERAVRFAYVNRASLNSAQNGSLIFSNKVLSNEDIVPVLKHFHFAEEGGKFLAPGAEPIPVGDRQHMIHYFNNLEEVRVYVRAREFLAVDNDSSESQNDASSQRRRSRRVTSGCPTGNVDMHANLFSLRLWAAASTAPLPKWVPPAASPGNIDNDMISSTNRDGIPAEREAVTELEISATHNGVSNGVFSGSEEEDQERLPAAREAGATAMRLDDPEMVTPNARLEQEQPTSIARLDNEDQKVDSLPDEEDRKPGLGIPHP
jgi:hypothetical protein